MAKSYLGMSTLFAEVYNCGAYGVGNYNENTCTTSGAPGAPSTGVVGVETVGGAGIGLALVILAVIVMNFRKKKATK